MWSYRKLSIWSSCNYHFSIGIIYSSILVEKESVIQIIGKTLHFHCYTTNKKRRDRTNEKQSSVSPYFGVFSDAFRVTFVLFFRYMLTRKSAKGHSRNYDLSTKRVTLAHAKGRLFRPYFLIEFIKWRRKGTQNANFKKRKQKQKCIEVQSTFSYCVNINILLRSLRS